LITFLVAAAAFFVTVRVAGLRPMPVAGVAAALGFAVNVFGVLPAPPTPLDAAAKEVRHYQRGQAKSLTCHLRVYDALDAEAGRVAAADRACAAAEAHWD
jgi:hypothetical protein